MTDTKGNTKGKFYKGDTRANFTKEIQKKIFARKIQSQYNRKLFRTKNTKEYKKYSDLSKIKISNRLFNTYDYYVKNKYKIDINYKALGVVKNYFN